VIFFSSEKEVFGGENLGISEKGTEGVERRKNIKGLAEKRLVGKMITQYRVERNIWFYFREMTIKGAFAILHICYSRNSFAGNEKA